MALLFFLLLAIVAAAMFAAGIYLIQLDKKRGSVDTLRGLEMVPLLIHLPPLSDDTQIGGRDVRDVVDETISKAQIIYNIISSTAEKNKESKLFGQRHITFEIVGSKGFVYFYTSVPAGLIDVVKQAIVSAYPAAQLEETEEPNIFNEAGGSNAVSGGEMVLKEPYAFPIATYQELKRDALQGVLSALATLDKEDGVSLQILLRPAHKGWRKAAISVASKKRKGNYDTKSGLEKVGPVLKQMVTALNKPPEGKEDSKGDNDISSLDRSVIDAIEDKTRYSGFEVAVRLVVSSNVTQRTQAILQNLVASFSLFDSAGKNGFTFEPSKDTQGLINDYLLRTFKKKNNKMVLNAVELATLFHFPDQNNMPSSQVTRQDSKQVDGPRNMPEQGLLLGYNVFRGAKKPIRLSLQDRQRHMYAVGQTGTGKSTFLENLALQDMLNGDGFAFVDPHGDTVEKLLSMVPKERTEDVIYFSPADMDYPMGLNLFEFNTPDQKDFLVQEALNMLYKLYDPQHQGIMGPRYEHLFRNAAMTVMADPAGGTFVDIPKLFRDPSYVKQKLKYVTDPNVREFWEKEMPQSQRSNEFGDVVSWFVSKFGAFLSNEMMRNIIGQTKSAFDLRDVMDNKKILLVNLSKGRTGELNSKLLGMIFVMKFQAAAMSRANIPENDRVDFSLFVDEFQNFSTDSFATIMSEARKFHLNLIVANQFTTQLTEEIRDAVFGNVGSTIAFRVADRDAESLNKYFRPSFDETDLVRLPNYNTIVRTMIHGVPTQPFSMATLPPLGSPNMHLASALKQLSSVKYGKPRKRVEEEIFARMKTIEPPAAKPFASGADAWGSARPGGSGPSRPSMGGMAPVAPAGAGRPMVPPASPNPKPASGSSFLDEWLEKRKQPLPPQASTARTAAPVAPAQAPRPSQAVPAPARAPGTAQSLPQAPTRPMVVPQGRHFERVDEPESEAPDAHTGKSDETSGASHGDELHLEHRERTIQPPKHSAPKRPINNISSEQLDNAEIDTIASQLKQSLTPLGAPRTEHQSDVTYKPQSEPQVRHQDKQQSEPHIESRYEPAREPQDTKQQTEKPKEKPKEKRRAEPTSPTLVRPQQHTEREADKVAAGQSDVRRNVARDGQPDERSVMQDGADPIKLAPPPAPPAGEHEPEDTIYIDQDGNLVNTQSQA